MQGRGEGRSKKHPEGKFLDSPTFILPQVERSFIMSAGVCRVSLNGKLYEQQCVSVFTFGLSVAGVYPTQAQLADWFLDLFSHDLFADITSHWVTETVSIEVPNAGKWGLIAEYPLVMTGSSASEALPNQVAACVTGITASRRRAKKYIAGLTEATQAGGVIDPGVIDNLQHYATTWLNGIPTPSGTAFVSGVCDKHGANFIPLTGTRVNGILSTQVRRKIGRGK